MAKTFKVHERAPHRPNRCVVTGSTGSKENPLIDLDVQIDYYGMVYLSYATLVAIAHQLGFATPEVATMLRSENESMKKRLDRIPAVTERLVNDIRDISISASADLLSDATPVIPANDKGSEQSDSGANLDYFGDNQSSQPDSEPAGSEGPASVPAGNGSKRTTNPNTKRSSSSN